MQLRNNKLVHMADGSSDHFTFTFNNNDTITGEPCALTKGNIVPSVNTTYQMGKADAKWSNIFTDIITSSTQVTNSDRRLKNNIVEFYDDDNKLQQLRPVTFNWNKSFNKSEKKQYGFVAQDVRKIFPDLVGDNEDGTLTVNYTGMISILTTHIKKLYKLLDEKQDKNK